MEGDELIKSWMENYPESSSGNCLRCTGWNHEKMQFDFYDEEEDAMHYVNMASLRKGLKILLGVIKQGRYHNSMGQIPHILAEGYDDDAQDHDALVQCALFGDVIYG